MKVYLISVAMAAIVVSASTFAAGDRSEAQLTNDLENAAGKQTPDFNQIDSDQDGAITRDEAADVKGLSDKWSDLDENEDGRLNRTEFSAFEKASLQEHSKRLERAADEAEDRIDNAN